MFAVAAYPIIALLTLVGCQSCEDDSIREPGGGEAQGVAPMPAVVAARAVAEAASFDLVSTPSGALLFYGPPAAMGGGLHVQALDPRGAPVSDARPVVEPDGQVPLVAAEVAAATASGRLGIAWIEWAGEATRVVATHGQASAVAFAPPEDLGPTQRVEPASRGQVVVTASRDGTLSTIHRSMPGPCVEGGSEECIHFNNRRLGASRGPRRGMPLALPEPCARPLAGYAYAGDVWYYGLCVVEQAQQATTLYAIQFDPQYAHAEPLLAGCEPRGLARVGEGVWLSAHCSDGSLGVVHIAEAGRQRTVARPAALSAWCEDGRPVLSAGNLAPLSLSEPQHGVEAALAPGMAPPGARAAWTGTALLVAEHVGGRVSLRRYECDGSELRRTDQS